MLRVFAIIGVLFLALASSACIVSTSLGVYDCQWSPTGLICYPVEVRAVSSH